ncbi:MAG: polysaccharide deacetylase family protein, partial [Planctomycetaceae bacterium]|nr:polysaccharide deacetylase family protein [Planctomycetaceae bacterium]
FFLVGCRAARHSALVRRIEAEGHTIGTHTHSHLPIHRLGAEAYVADCVRGRQVIEEILGRRCDLFRPPFGELTPGVLLQLLARGFRIVHWSKDTRDFAAEDCDEIIQWFRPESMLPGEPCGGTHDGAASSCSNVLRHRDIVLMHDNRQRTTLALPDCLRILKEQQVQLSPLEPMTRSTHRR